MSRIICYMKKIIITFALVCISLFAFAQNSSILRPRIEIAEKETEIAEMFDTELEVFYMNDEDPRMYYLSLGNLGIGNDLVQIDFDPVYELFIPLGGTLEEAIAKMEEIKAFYKEPRQATMEIDGCFAALYPNDKLTTVKVTRRQILTPNILEFSIPNAGSESLIRATHITKSDFGGLLSALKIYKKLHPKQK